MTHESPWTSERIELLADLAAKGYSAGVIANELGCTRMAVIGKCRREGIPLLRVPNLRLAYANSTITKVQRPRQPKVFRPKSQVPLPFIPPHEELIPLKIPYMELKDHHCRYLLDERGEDGLKLSCGHPVMEGHSWCFTHSYAVYNDFICYQEAAE